jgi:hypothetical protein
MVDMSTKEQTSLHLKILAPNNIEEGTADWFLLNLHHGIRKMMAMKLVTELGPGL